MCCEGQINRAIAYKPILRHGVELWSIQIGSDHIDSTPAATLVERFSKLRDPRDNRAKRHTLIDVVVIAICAVHMRRGLVGGCGVVRQVEEGLARSVARTAQRHRIASHDTFGRVFARLDAMQFQECFVDWVSAVSEVTRGQVVAIDGKTLRRSHDRLIGKSAIHMVSAWAATNRLVLGQTRVDDRSNEITAIPDLLGMLDVSGCTVTIDAMGCHKQISSTITEKGADYVLALKQNEPRLHDDVTEMFAEARKTDFASLDHDFCETVNKEPARIETRRCWSVSDPDHIGYINDRQEWSELTSIAMVESERLVDGKMSRQVRYYISSLPNRADRMLSAVRGHWGIENSVHWTLDVAFDEDDCRVRVGNDAENFSTLDSLPQKPHPTYTPTKLIQVHEVEFLTVRIHNCIVVS